MFLRGEGVSQAGRLTPRGSGRKLFSKGVGALGLPPMRDVNLHSVGRQRPVVRTRKAEENLQLCSAIRIGHLPGEMYKAWTTSIATHAEKFASDHCFPELESKPTSRELCVSLGNLPRPSPRLSQCRLVRACCRPLSNSSR